MVSGQAPVTDDQNDCPAYDQDGAVDLRRHPGDEPNYGQFVSAAGAERATGDNGCVYPSSVPTLFNQLDAAHDSWKVYAQDLGNPDGTDDSATHRERRATSRRSRPAARRPTASVRRPRRARPATRTRRRPRPTTSTAAPTPRDQYVAKHNPLPWFESLLPSGDGRGTGGNTCADHLAALFGPNDQLYNGPADESTTPEFSYIVPNNCTNGHDAVCAGNNLSGLSANAHERASIPRRPTTPAALYAESKFLAHRRPRDRAVAGVQAERPDRRHLRRGLPAVHVAATASPTRRCDRRRAPAR